MGSDVLATKLVLHITPSTKIETIGRAEHGAVADIFDVHGGVVHRPIHLAERLHPANVFFRLNVGAAAKMKEQFAEMAKLGCMGYDNFGVLLSGIRDNNDLYRARVSASEAGLNLGSHMPFGMMVEYPSLAMLHEEITNKGPTCMIVDLDAISARMLGSSRHDSIHPSVAKIIDGMKDECQKSGVSLGVFGSSLKNRDSVAHLVRSGVDFLVVAPENAEGTRKFAFHAEKLRELDFMKAKIKMQMKSRSI